MNLVELRKNIVKFSTKERAKSVTGFFKTGKGEYGAGDVFIGIDVPSSRKLAKQFCKELTFSEVENLLRSKIHEERMIALFILVLRFKKGDPAEKQKVFRLFVKNMKWVNNWDLVDSSAPYILGPHLENKSRQLLYKLANSKDLWQKRISVLATFHFIRNGDFKDFIKIAEILLTDDHDLIHKAVGWMLREVGQRNILVEENFLKKHAVKMPRTMLRYAVEKFPEKKRKQYLKMGK